MKGRKLRCVIVIDVSKRVKKEERALTPDFNVLQLQLNFNLFTCDITSRLQWELNSLLSTLNDFWRRAYYHYDVHYLCFEFEAQKMYSAPFYQFSITF